MKKDLRDIAVVTLGLSVAYGLGVITGLCIETKLLLDVYTEVKKDLNVKRERPSSYGDYYK